MNIIKDRPITKFLKGRFSVDILESALQKEEILLQKLKSKMMKSIVQHNIEDIKSAINQLKTS